MTENYKENLLKYLTGNLSIEEKSDVINYENTITKDTELLLDQYSVRGYVDMVDTNGMYNGKTLVYGRVGSINDYHSFIALYENETILMLKETYSSGSDFGFIYTLEKEEDGQLYGVEYYNGRPRFIMLNNISEPNSKGEYEVRLRQSYYLQGSVLAGFNANQDYGAFYAEFYLGKSAQSSTYVIWLLDFNENASSLALTASNLKINVGETNEWSDYTLSVSLDGGSLSIGVGKYIYFDKYDKPHVELYLYESSTDKLNVYMNTDLVIDTKENIYSNVSTDLFGTNGHFYSVISTKAEMINLAPNKWYWFAQGYITGSNNTSKRACCIVNQDKEICLYKETTSFSASWNNIPFGVLRLINNQPMMYLRFPTVPESIVANQWIGFIPEPGELNPYLEQIPDCNTGSYTPIVVINNLYNLYNCIAFYKILSNNEYIDKFTNWQIVYNVNNYNNKPYENVNSLIGNNGMLFDSDNNLIFARNLYNYKVFNNRVISALNVPNIYLNEKLISSESLLSQTNTVMLQDTVSVTKNIYEDLYINNFITLNMENQNEDIYKTNKTGAINLTQSAFKNGDYENAKATKIKVTYSDNSIMITSAEATISNGVATYDISIYIPSDKDIDHIDIISEDESVVYQTITNETISRLSLQKNKYYHITQDVHVE